MGLIRIISICCLLTGCSTTRIIVKPTPPPIIVRPVLATSTINTETSPSDIVKSYRVTIQQLIDYSKQLEIIIDGYKEQSK